MKHAREDQGIEGMGQQALEGLIESHKALGGTVPDGSDAGLKSKKLKSFRNVKVKSNGIA